MADRLAIVTTHPIQYNAPWFKLLAAELGLSIKVFYTWEQSQKNEKYDPGFGKVIGWDIPLLEGYDYTFVKNIAPQPGSHHFKGIDNPTLISEIEQWGADSVLVFGWPFKSHLACLRHFKGKIPVLFRGDSTLLDEQQGVKKLLRRMFLRYVYRHIDYALYVGTNNKTYFRAHGLKEKQLCHVPHAIDNDRFSQPDDKYTIEADTWRAELQLADDNFVLLFAGKLEAKKDPGFMLQLAKALPASHYRFIIAGNGPMEQQLKEAAAHDKRIIFIDFQNQQQMPVLYRMAHVFILPSKGPGETWGLAINEAMACGRPVVSTTLTGGAIDLINNNGIIIEPGDTKSTAGYITQLASDKGIYAKAATASKQQVKDFSFSTIVNNISSLLKSI
jgi:glycosyltransferase involved in cell wall biosynthesis